MLCNQVKFVKSRAMSRYLYAFLYALLVISALEPASAKRSYSSGGGARHSYPRSGGLSGGSSHHGYPASGGLSGNNHGYPSSGGLSGGHGYPSSGGMSGHASGGSGYPSSGNNRGYPSSGSNHGYPSSGGSHGYPASGGLSGSNTHHSGSHGYPAGKGLNGNTNTVTTNIHHHYHYNPPQQISYTPYHGGAPVSYPVYRGAPPTYVYQYKDSGSKYGTLIAGLALLNLGTLAAGTAYAVSHSHNSNSNGNYNSYRGQPGEVCKFGLKRDNGDYEETRIDCQLISSFIYEEQAKAQTGATNTTITTTTVTNTTVFNTTGAAQPEANTTAPVANPVFALLPNGTYVPLNITLVSNDTSSAHPENAPSNVTGTMTSSSSVTTTTTVQNALDVKGAPVSVTPGMVCYVIRNSSNGNMKRSVPCGLLQTYADRSLQRNSGFRTIPAFTLLAVVCSIMLF